MAFTVETGAGLADANAYMTEQEYRDFHADRGVDVTAQLTGAVTAAIVKATDYVDKRFGQRFRGWKSTEAQQLEWPRNDADDDDGHSFQDVPRILKAAIAEYAWLSTQLQRELAPMPGISYPVVDPVTGLTTTQGGGNLKAKTEKVDVIEESVEFTSDGQPMTSTGNLLTQHLPEYPQADLWIEELLRNDRYLTRG